MWEVVAGFGAGLTLSLLMAAVQKKQLEQRAELVAASLATGGQDMQLYMQVRGVHAEQKLAYIAEQYTRELAQAVGQKHLGQTYGLTEERINKLRQLGEWT